MSRNQKKEEILSAWWEWEHCDPPHKASSEQILNGLLDKLIGEKDFTREQVLDHLFSEYKEYKAALRKSAKVKIAQSLTGNPN